jgi:hypothetical protein
MSRNQSDVLSWTYLHEQDEPIVYRYPTERSCCRLTEAGPLICYSRREHKARYKARGRAYPSRGVVGMPCQLLPSRVAPDVGGVTAHGTESMVTLRWIPSGHTDGTLTLLVWNRRLVSRNDSMRRSTSKNHSRSALAWSSPAGSSTMRGHNSWARAYPRRVSFSFSASRARSSSALSFFGPAALARSRSRAFSAKSDPGSSPSGVPSPCVRPLLLRL